MLILLLLAVSLSLDAFAVSLAYGFRQTKIPFPSVLIIGLCSVFYFGAAVWFGEFISSFLPEKLASILGIVLMAFICLYMIFSLIVKSKPEEPHMPKTLVDFTLKSVGISIKIIRDPMLCDMDGSKSISAGEAFFLGTALSVDSISVGIGYSLTGAVNLWAPVLVGIIQFTLLTVGNIIGLQVNKNKIKHQDKLQFVSVAAMIILLILRIINIF